jgi:hypothetical protein
MSVNSAAGRARPAAVWLQRTRLHGGCFRDTRGSDIPLFH